MTEQKWLSCTDLQLMRQYPPHRGKERKWQLFAAGCCRQLWPLFVDPRAREAVETVERWADGQATREELTVAHLAVEAAWKDARLRALREADAQGLTWATILFHRDQLKGAIQAARAALARGEVDVDAVETRFRKRAIWGALDEARSAICVCLHGPGHTDFRLWSTLPVQPALLRDVFGNPFRPVALNPAWLLWDGSSSRNRARPTDHYTGQPPLPVEHPVRSLVLDTSELKRSSGKRALKAPFHPVRAWSEGPVGRLAHAIYEQNRWQDLPLLADTLEEAGCSDASLLDHLRQPGLHVRGCFAVDLLIVKE
jgi:hypothetical protein